MNLLLDTHIFIWSVVASAKLSANARTALAEQANTLSLSVASVREMQLKVQANKLSLPVPLPQMVEEQQRINNLQILPIELTHIYELEKLPYHHKDPFDRLLIAQALVEKLTLVSVDPNFPAYGVKLLT